MDDKDITRKWSRMIHDGADYEHRVRLYKKGKTWVSAGITTAFFGLFSVIGAQQVHADTTDQSSQATSQSVTATTQTSSNSVALTSSSSAAQTQTTDDTTAATETTDSQSKAVTDDAADQPSDSTATTSGKTDTTTQDSTTAKADESSTSETAKAESTQTKADESTKTAQTTHLVDPSDSELAAAKQQTAQVYATTGQPQKVTAIDNVSPLTGSVKLKFVDKTTGATILMNKVENNLATLAKYVTKYNPDALVFNDDGTVTLGSVGATSFFDTTPIIDSVLSPTIKGYTYDSVDPDSTPNFTIDGSNTVVIYYTKEVTTTWDGQVVNYTDNLNSADPSTINPVINNGGIPTAYLTPTTVSYVDQDGNTIATASTGDYASADLNTDVSNTESALLSQGYTVENDPYTSDIKKNNVPEISFDEAVNRMTAEVQAAVAAYNTKYPDEQVNLFATNVSGSATDVNNRDQTAQTSKDGVTILGIWYKLYRPGTLTANEKLSTDDRLSITLAITTSLRENDDYESLNRILNVNNYMAMVQVFDDTTNQPRIGLGVYYAPSTKSYKVSLQKHIITYGTYTTTRTINFTSDDDSLEIPDPAVQTVTYNTATDDVSGQTVYTPAYNKTNGLAYYDNYSISPINGYIADKTTIDKEQVTPVTVKPQNETVTVNYVAQPGQASVTYVDDDANGTNVNFDVINGLIGKQDNYTVAVPEGYELTSGQQINDVAVTDGASLPITVTSDSTDNIVIHLQHIMNHNPSNVDQTTLQKAYTVKVTASSPDGSDVTPTGGETTQVIHFTRHAIVDEVTGSITYTPWQEVEDINADYTEVDAKAVPNYTAYVNRVEAQSVTKANFQSGLDAFKADVRTLAGASSFAITYKQTTFTVDHPGTGLKTQASQLQKTVTETVNYGAPQSGSQVVETVTYYRTATIADPDTPDDVTYSAWTTDKTANTAATGAEVGGTFDALTTDELKTPKGYTAKVTDASGNDITANTETSYNVKDNDDNQAVNIVLAVSYDKQTGDTYTPTKNPENLELTKTVNVSVNYGAPVNETDDSKTGALTPITFYRTATTDPTKDASDVNYYTYSAWTTNSDGVSTSDADKSATVDGHSYVDDSKTPVNYTESDQTLIDGLKGDVVTATTNNAVINVSYKLTTNTPSQPGNTDQTDKDALTKKVTEVVSYGSPVGGNETLQTVTYYRTATTKDDGSVVYSAWTTDSDVNADTDSDATDSPVTGSFSALTADQLKTPADYTATVTTSGDTTTTDNSDAEYTFAGNATNDGLTITRQVTYTARTQSAVVLFIDAGTGANLAQITVTGKIGSSVDHAPVAAEIQTILNQGYNLAADGTIGAVYGASAGQTFVVKMNKIETVPYTITPIDESGNPIGDPIHTSGKTGDPIEAPSIDGYTPVPGQTSKVPGANGTVAIVYKTNTPITPITTPTTTQTVTETPDNVPFTVQPVDKAGNPIGDPIQATGKPGEPVTYPAVEGYTPEDNQTVLVPDANGTVEVVYVPDQVESGDDNANVDNDNNGEKNTDSDQAATQAKSAVKTATVSAGATYTATDNGETATAKKLPQTNENEPDAMAVTGLGLMGMLSALGLAGLGKKRKKHDGN